MMRRPSTQDELYSWHRAALRGDRPAVYEDDPQCGWFKFRYVRGGPWVPARIWCEQIIDDETGELAAPELLRAEANGLDANPYKLWIRCAGKPITEDEYHALMGAHERDETMQATHATVDLTAKAMRP